MGAAVGSSQWGASNTCCFNAVDGTSGTCHAFTEPRGNVFISHVIFRKLRDLVGVFLFSRTSEIPPQTLLEVTQKSRKNRPSVSVTMEAAGVSFVPSTDVTGVTNEKDAKTSHALTRAYSGSSTSSESRSLTLKPEETTYDNKTGNGSGRNSYQFEGAAVVRETIAEGHGALEHKGLMRISKVGCITRLVLHKGLHLIRHAIYRMLELGGQLVLLGSSPVPQIQGEVEELVNHFKGHPNVRLILKYEKVLSNYVNAASDMFSNRSIFEPYGLTEMIAMRFGSVPIVRKTGGLNDCVFDVNDDTADTVLLQFCNGFTYLFLDEQGVNCALDRAFNLYMKNNESWQQLVKQNMISVGILQLHSM